MAKQEMDFKGVFIPASMWLHKELSWTARIILVQIYYLSKEGVGCFASNAFLAGFVGLSENYVRNLISKLTAEGYLVQTQKGRRRMMFVTCKTGLTASQKCDTDVHTCHDTSQKCDDSSQKCDEVSQKCDEVSQKSDHKYIYKNNINTEREETALSIYHEIYPDYHLDVFSSERLAAFEVEPGLWRETVVNWRTNNYRPNNLIGMMDAYTRKKAHVDETQKPENVPMVYCKKCEETSGLVKVNGGWTRCSH